ncbi:MAG: putative Ntn-hydrolase superfamily protein, partial [Planctomycetota bacterium]
SWLRRGALALAASFCVAPALSATWSIVIVDTATGQVCVASATCIVGADLQNLLPVMRVGVGGAAAQSAIDQTGGNRFRIWQGFIDGKTPQDILDELAANDTSHDQRQYGIVNMDDMPVKFTGNKAGNARASVQGTNGTEKHAVQGNVLTAKKVVFQSRKTLVRSHGDLAQRVMMAMETARDLGGDGRCSCPTGMPEDCGAPPAQFDSSAAISFIVMSRIGDTDGLCDAINGCANGDYYLSLNVTPGKPKVDAVSELRKAFDIWRADLAGHPDHLLSIAEPEATALPADGQTRTTVHVMLRDVDGIPITNGTSLVEVTTESGSPITALGPVLSDGNGGYSFDVIAGTTTGLERFIVTADDGTQKATLYPYLEVRLDAPTGLHSGFDAISAQSESAIVPFTIDLGTAAAGDPYLLLGSFSGTTPGQQLGNLFIPLNFDSFFEFSARNPGPPTLPGSAGALDSAGRAQAFYDTTPVMLGELAGLRLDWAVLTASGQVAGPVGFDILP